MKGTATQGMTMLELLIAMALASILMIGLVHFASASASGNQLMENQAVLQDQLRVSRRVLARSIMQAGFTPRPWDTEFLIAALGDGTANAYSSGNDRLVLRSLSDRNCFENLNPVKDSEGNAAYYIRESTFDVSGDKHLTRDCRYGPALSDMTVQIRRQGLVHGVESFQALFGEDSDGDGNVDTWTRAQEWTDVHSVTGIRVGLLLSSQEEVTAPTAETYRVLDETETPRADGRLRISADLVFALRGKGR